MRTWLIGIIVFMGWSFGCTYWYVCQIKGLCPEGLNMFGPSTTTESARALPMPPSDTAKGSAQRRQPLPIPEDAGANTAEEKTIPEALTRPYTVLFAFAGPQTEGKSAMEAYLNELAAFLKQHPKKKVVLKGYTDDTAARENNIKLSQRRCETIAELIMGKGVPQSQIITEPLGEAEPVATNETPEGRRLNRRVVISIQEVH